MKARREDTRLTSRGKVVDELVLADSAFGVVFVVGEVTLNAFASRPLTRAPDYIA